MNRSTKSSPSDSVLPLFRPRRRGPLAPLGRAVAWHRRKLAVLAAMIAVLCTVSAAAPADPPTVPVVVAHRDLAGGHLLTGDDLRIERYPTALAPADALTEPAPIEGRMLIGSAGRGTPIGRGAVVAPRDLNPGAGRSMVPIRLDDPGIVGLLRVGDLIDVLATGSGDAPSRTIAAGARILAFPAQESGAGPLGASSGPAGRLVLLEVSPGEASELVAAESRDRLAIVLR